MAKAYLGKISAIVTANTSDFNSKLNASAKEVRTFAAAMQSTLSRAESGAAASLRSIYTEAQKTERALKAAASLRLSFKGIDTSKFKDIGEAADQFRRVTSAAEQIYKPLAQAAKATESLSNEVRGEFQPALIAAQRQAELMNTALTSGLAVSEKSFARVQRRAEETAQAVRRLTEASQAVGGLATGRELRFQSPAFAKSLQDAKNLQQRADTIDPSRGAQLGLGSAIENQRIAAARAERANARLEATRLRPDTDPTKGGRLAAAEQNASAATASFNEANAALQRIVSSEEEAALAAGKLATSASAADAAAKSLAASFERLRASANQALTGVPQTVSQARQEFDSLLSQVGRLTAAGRGAAAPLTNELISLFEAAANGDENIDAVIAKLKELKFVVADVGDVNAGSIGLSSQNFPGNTQGNPTGPQSPPLPPGFGGQSDAGLGATLGDSGRQITLLRSGIVSLKSQLDTMPASVRSQFIPALKDAESEFLRLAAIGPGAVSTEIDKAARKLDGLTQRAARAGRGQNFSDQFGGRGAQGLELNLQDVSLRGYTAQLQILQQTLAGVSSTARGPALAAFNDLRKAIANAARNGTLDLASTRQELARLTTNAVNAAAAVGTISPGRLAGQLKRAGDIGRGAFGNLGLAAAQAGFAIDDFFSVTGNFEQRLRAVSNNISQLGFIVGGTTGLFAALSVTIGAQAVLALYKYALGGKEAEEQQKRLKFQIEAVNSSLERQRSLAQELASAYESLARSIASGGLSERGRTESGRRREIEDISDTQRKRRAEIVEQNNPAVSGRRARVAQLQKQLEEETDTAARERIAAQIAALEATIGNILKGAERNADLRIESARRISGRLGTTPLRELQGDRDRVRDELSNSRKVRDTLGAENAPRWVEKIEELSAELAVLEVAIQKLNDSVVNAASNRAFSISDQLGRAQRNVSSVEGFTASEQAANQFSTTLESLLKRLSQADTEPSRDAIVKQIESLSNFARAVEVASTATEALARALRSSASDLAKAVESELTSRGDSLRRQANSTEAQFGANDQRTRIARSDVDQIEAARRSATENRQRIEDEVSRARLDFESSVLAGRGDPQATQISTRIAQLEELIAKEATPASDKESARLEIDRLKNDLNTLFENLPGTQDLRRRADLGDVRAQMEVQDVEGRARGRELAKTPAARAGEDLAQQLKDVEASFGVGELTQAQRDATLGRLTQDAMRQAAPAIFGMADQVQNAVLQGPSRAALQASDVTTMQGASELNRLIRGDDSAKNVDLVELQKQSKALEQLVAIAVANGTPPGVFN